MTSVQSPKPSGTALAGRRVLVVGGSSRMGLAVARDSALQGAEVIIVGRDRQRLEAAALAIQFNVRSHSADFTISSEVERLMRDLSPFDHVVVTASAKAPATSITDTSPEVAQAAFARFWLSYHVLHFARHTVRAGGSITLLSGSSGRRPVAGYGVWGSLHGSIEALARSAALELAPIRVNVVSPGGIGIRTDRQLVHHAGQPDDVAKMVLAVMTNPAVTNAVIDVDGGERLGTWSG